MFKRKGISQISVFPFITYPSCS